MFNHKVIVWCFAISSIIGLLILLSGSGPSALDIPIITIGNKIISTQSESIGFDSPEQIIRVDYLNITNKFTMWTRVTLYNGTKGLAVLYDGFKPKIQSYNDMINDDIIIPPLKFIIFRNFQICAVIFLLISCIIIYIPFDSIIKNPNYQKTMKRSLILISFILQTITSFGIVIISLISLDNKEIRDFLETNYTASLGPVFYIVILSFIISCFGMVGFIYTEILDRKSQSLNSFGMKKIVNS